MSWQLASFAIVLASLVAAFWWYERSQPPAKLLAIVAALAALAALGRDAFAAVPDVKPITAIVLVAGVAFGAAPGFAVGALAALASNVLLGEGPWTPWQMLGWGLVGTLGGALGAASARRPSALAIALACALAAELFNLLLNVYTWTSTGEQTLAGFGVVLGAAAAFDITHVVASFAFGLAFGAVLLRMLMRVRSRLHVSWEAPAALLVAMLVLHAVPLAGSTGARASTASAPHGSIARAVAYLQHAQNPDGGFGAAPGQLSSPLYTAWAAIGLAAAGRSPARVLREGHTVLAALRAGAGSLQGIGDLERTILALHAGGAPAHSLAGSDPTARLLSHQGRDGSFSHLSNLTAFAILALRAAGLHAHSAPVRSAAHWLARQQEADGGFGFAARSGSGGTSDVDDTGAALQALIAAGQHGTVVARARSYLMRAQDLDGGYPQQTGESSNAQSTAWAVQGLDASGADVARVRRRGSPSPLAYLQSLMNADGSIRYSRTSTQTPVWVTSQALAALAGRPLPVSAPRAAGTAASPRTPQSGHASSIRAGHGAHPHPLGVRARPRSGSAAQTRTEAAARALGALAGMMLSPVAG